MGRKIRECGIPKTAEKVIKGTDTGGIQEFKSTKDSQKWINLQPGNPFSQGMDLEINRQQIGTVHTGRGPGPWTKDRVFRTQKFIEVRKIKIPEMFNDIPYSS